MSDQVMHWALGAGLTMILAIISWPVKMAFTKTKEALETVADIKKQVDQAVTNHLHHIEASTCESAKQTTKIAEQMVLMNADNRELIGYLKGVVARHGV